MIINSTNQWNNVQLWLRNILLKRERKGDKWRQIVLTQGWLWGHPIEYETNRVGAPK